MIRKLRLTVLLFCLTTGCLYAQSIQLIISNPSPYIADWQSRTETATLIVNNTQSQPVQVKIKTELFDGKGTLVAKTIASKMPVLTIPPGVSKYNAEDLFPLSAVSYNGSNGTTIAQIGRIPDGNYSFCVSLTNPQTGAPAGQSGIQCKTFNIVAWQAPVLLSPLNNKVLSVTAVKGMLFKWTPVSPAPGILVTYRLQVWEVLPGQDNITALKTNQPIVEKEYKGLLQTTWPLDFALPETGKKYVWTVTPFDNQNRKMVEGHGFAEPFGFSIANNTLKSTSAMPSPGTTTTPGAGNDTAAVGDTIKAGLNGEFNVIVLQSTTESDGSLTGKGKVYIDWLMTSVAVEFKKIRIDSTKRLSTGGIVSTQGGSSSTSWQTYPLAWALSLTSGPGGAAVVDQVMTWTNNQISSLANWTVNSIVGQPVINYQSTIAPPPIPDNSLKMPFGLQFNTIDGNQQLVITEMLFKPNESKVNFLAQVHFTKSGTLYPLGFVGKGFKIHPGSIEFSIGRVELAEDITIPDPKIEFTFKKGTDTTGCYVQWASNGINNMGLGLEVAFTRDWLIPVPSATPTSKVKASFSGNGTSMQDILLTGNLPDCELAGTNGMKIQASQLLLDLSDIRNPAGITFPVSYPGITTVDWQGFYMQSFAVTLPETWKTGTNLSPPSVAASNFIIDEMGLTTKIKAFNVFNLQSGKVASLSASLDTVEISIVNSSLVNGSAKGLVVLPISDATAQNTLKYKATFAQATGINNFQLVIVPYQDIEASILKGKLALKQTSTITATKSSGTLTLSIALNGTFKWDNPLLNAPPSGGSTGSLSIRLAGVKGIKMEMGFENIGLAYTANSTTNTLAINAGTWNFASPQKRLANFPVTIKKVYYKSLSTVTPSTSGVKELVRGALMIDIVANLTEDIGGTTTVGAAFAVELNTATEKFAPKFKGVFMDSINVHANLSAVKIQGFLAMYDNDPKFGDGFKATMGVTFTAVSLQINALVQFGNTTWNNNNQYYRYWRAEADVKLPVGIPFLTGVGFYGFGGGAFYNMKANMVASISDPGNTAYTFEPKKSALGFIVKATVGTLPKFETFNTDVALTAVFSASGGLTKIGFLGNFWLAAELSERAASKIKGTVAVSYNFPDKLFNMAAGLSIKVTEDGTPTGNPVITTPTPIGFVMNINGRTNKWYFQCGTPATTNTVNIFGINLYSYLMFGNDIPVPGGFTQKFKTAYASAIGTSPTMGNVGSGGVGDETKTGKGIATGAGVQFNRTYNDALLHGVCRDWSIAAALNTGAELNLALMDQTGCAGINGYRASGNVGLYFNVTTTVTGTNYRWPNINGCATTSSNLFTIKMGSWAGGEFPNPVYLYGAVGAEIGLFNELVKLRFDKSFTYGTSCAGTVIAVANAAQEDKAADMKNKLIQYLTPSLSYNFPVTSTINVKYALVPDQVFDIAQNEGDGTIKNRTFKMVVTRTLEVKNANGTWVPVTIQTRVNNTGEYQYYIKPPISAGTGISLNQSTPLVTGNQFNASNGNMLYASGGNLNLFLIPSPLPPPPPPNYPNPIPDPVNTLVADKDYRFVVTATLMELSMKVVPATGVFAGKGNGTMTVPTWSPAMTRTGLPVTETKTKLFRTGSMPVASVSNTAPKIK